MSVNTSLQETGKIHSLPPFEKGGFYPPPVSCCLVFTGRNGLYRKLPAHQRIIGTIILASFSAEQGRKIPAPWSQAGVSKGDYYRLRRQVVSHFSKLTKAFPDQTLSRLLSKCITEPDFCPPLHDLYHKKPAHTVPPRPQPAVTAIHDPATKPLVICLEHLLKQPGIPPLAQAEGHDQLSRLLVAQHRQARPDTQTIKDLCKAIQFISISIMTGAYPGE